MQTSCDCSRNDTKEVPLNSVQKCLDLICCKKTSFFSWTWPLSQILKAGPWKCLNLIQAKISNVQENIPFLECGHYLKFWRCALESVWISSPGENIKCARKYPVSPPCSCTEALLRRLKQSNYLLFFNTSFTKHITTKRISAFGKVVLHIFNIRFWNIFLQTHNYKTNIRFLRMESPPFPKKLWFFPN